MFIQRRRGIWANRIPVVLWAKAMPRCHGHAPFVRLTDMQILTADLITFRWQSVHNSTSQSDLPASCEIRHYCMSCGSATFTCRVPRKEGLPGNLYEMGLTGSLS